MWGPVRLHKSYSHDRCPIGSFLVRARFFLKLTKARDLVVRIPFSCFLMSMFHDESAL